MKKKDLSHSKIYIGIDPGRSGALCVIEDDFIKAYPCPDNVQDMALMFAMAISVSKTKTVVAYIERYGQDQQMDAHQYGSLQKTMEYGWA